MTTNDRERNGRERNGRERNRRERNDRERNDRESWHLDRAEVSIGVSSTSASTRRSRGMARASRADDTRSAVVQLTHVPTGLEVEGEIPPGHYSRGDLQKRRDALIADLWPVLQQRVAEHLGITHRPR